MKKIITMTTAHHMTEFRQVDFDEKDWEYALHYLKGHAEDKKSMFHKTDTIRYNAFKNFTWDEVYKAIKDKDKTLGDCEIRQKPPKSTYHTNVYDFFMDLMEDETCGSEPLEVEYHDGYTVDINYSDDNHKDNN